MSYYDWIDGISKRLVGKTVVAVEKPGIGISECICKITTNDGLSFRIHATDLGAWVEDDIRSDGLYPTLRALTEASQAYRWAEHPKHSWGLPEATVKINDGILSLDAFDGTLFKMQILDLTKEEKEVADRINGLELLAMMADGTDFWHMLINQTSVDKED